MRLSFCAGVIVEDQLFFSDNLFNGLFKSTFDSNINKAEYIGKFNDESDSVRLLHKKAIQYQDVIIFIPNRGTSIHVFDVNKGSLKAYRIVQQGDNNNSISDGVIIDNKLYIMPGNLLQPISVLDLRDYTLQTIDFRIKELLSITDRSPKGQFFWKAICMGKKIYMAIINTNEIISFDVETEQFEIMRINESILFNSVYKAGENMLISTVNAGVYLWDSKKKEMHEIIKDNDESNTVYFIQEYTNNKFIIIPDLGGDIFSLSCNKDNVTLEKCNITLPQVKGNRETGYLYEFGINWDCGVLLFPGFDYCMYYLKDNKIYMREIVYDEDTEVCEILRDGLCNELTKEGRPYTLVEYLSIVGNQFGNRRTAVNHE